MVESLAAHKRDEGARLAARCTACGACVRICPMLSYAPAARDEAAERVASGMRDVLLGGPGSPASLAWIGACTRSGTCSAACPEGLDAAYMLRLAQWRAKGALGEPPRVPPRDDPRLSSRVKAFARLGFTAEEQAQWL
jgi:ferredoxin